MFSYNITMPVVYLKLTPSQYKKLSSGKSVRYNPSADSGELFGIDLEPAVYKRYAKSLLSNKGLMLKGNVMESDTEGEVEGGKVNWKKVGRQLKKGINTVGVDIIEGTKKFVPKEVAQQTLAGLTQAGVLGATAALGMPNPALAQMASQQVGNATGAAYKTDFRKRDALKKFGKNFVEENQQDAIEGAMVAGGKLNLRKVGKRAKKFLNNEGVQILNHIQKNVDKGKLKEGLQKQSKNIIMNLTGDEKLANMTDHLNDVVDAGYNTNFSDKNAMKQLGRQLKGTRDNVYDDINNYVGGEGLKRGKFAKGSEEAKAYMAALRAKRGKGKVAKAVENIETKVIGQGFVPLGGRGFVPLGGRGFVPL